MSQRRNPSGATVKIMPMRRSGTAPNADQIDLSVWAQEVEGERTRLEQANKERSARRGYLVFATDPDRAPDEPGYRDVFATEAKTPGEATAKVRPLADGRRLRTYLATGSYKDELADAHWIA